MIPIDAALETQPRTYAAAARQPAAAPSVQKSHKPRTSAHLPEHYRRYIIVMLRTKQAQMPHPMGEAHGHVLDPIFKSLCAQAVVLLERMPPEKLRPISQFRMGETPPWQERLLLTIMFWLILRIADEGGHLHHRNPYLRLLSAVVPMDNPQFNIPQFLMNVELRLLKDIDYASYVNPIQLQATERRLDRWLTTKPVKLHKQAQREPETYRMAMLLSHQLGREANTMRPAIEERQRLRVPASPESPAMPTTPHGPGLFELAEIMRRQNFTAPKQAGYFDLPPPPMSEDLLTQAAPYNLGFTNGW